MTHFKTIWPDFCIVCPIDSFQDHMTWFFHCVPNWLLSRPLPQFYNCVPNWLLSRPFELILSLCTQWLFSRPFELILSLCTLLTPFKTISPSLIIVYPIDSFWDHMTLFYHCVPNWLLSRPFHQILSLCKLLTPFKTIWTNFRKESLGTQW